MASRALWDKSDLAWRTLGPSPRGEERSPTGGGMLALGPSPWGGKEHLEGMAGGNLLERPKLGGGAGARRDNLQLARRRGAPASTPRLSKALGPSCGEKWPSKALWVQR